MLARIALVGGLLLLCGRLGAVPIIFTDRLTLDDFPTKADVVFFPTQSFETPIPGGDPVAGTGPASFVFDGDTIRVEVSNDGHGIFSGMEATRGRLTLGHQFDGRSPLVFRFDRPITAFAIDVIGFGDDDLDPLDQDRFDEHHLLASVDGGEPIVLATADDDGTAMGRYRFFAIVDRSQPFREVALLGDGSYPGGDGEDHGERVEIDAMVLGVERPAEMHFEYRLNAPTRIGGGPGEVVRFGARVQLVGSTDQGEFPADYVGGWSVGVTKDTECWGGIARIVEATTAATVAALATDGGLRREDGFEVTELTDQDPANEGVVSAVVLSSTDPLVFLPPSRSPVDILALTVEVEMPDEMVCFPRYLAFRDGLVGSGEPVPNRVGLPDRSFSPFFRDAGIDVCTSCFGNDIGADDWRLVDVGDRFTGTARRLDDPDLGECYEICTFGRGHGPTSDEFPALTRDVRGDYDFVVGVSLFETLGSGEAGICARDNSRFPDGAYAGIALRQLLDGSFQVISSFRPSKGGEMVGAKPVEWKPGPIIKPAPIIYLALRREGARMTTLFGSRPDALREHLSIDENDWDLTSDIHEALMYGAALISPFDCPVKPIFCNPLLSMRERTTPPRIDAVFPTIGALDAATEVTILGEGLCPEAGLTEVTIAGIPAEVKECDDEALVVIALPPDTGQPLRGDVVVSTPLGSQALRDGFLYIGDSLIRGNCNGDRAVNIADAQYSLNYQFLGGPPPQCFPACDVNSDGRINIADAQYELNFLFLGGPRPSFPFPDPGVLLEPSIPCGLPPAPVPRSISQATIAQGDIVTIEGEHFDPDPSLNAVHFGEFPGEVLEASETSLLVEVPCLAIGGKIDVSVSRIHPGVLVQLCQPSPCSPGGIGLGVVSDLVVDRVRSDVLVLARTPGHEVGKPVWGIWLEFDPDAFAALRMESLTGFDITGKFIMPPVQGLTHGSISLRTELGYQPDPRAAKPFGLADLIGRVATVLSRDLGFPIDEKPVKPVRGKPGPIAPFSLHVDLENNRIGFHANEDLLPFLTDFLGSITIYPKTECPCDGLHPVFNQRAYGWCRFTQLIQPCNGLPRWEWFIPKPIVLSTSENVFPLSHPNSRHHFNDKRTMYNKPAYCHVRKHELWNLCKLQELWDDGEIEVPDFPCEAIVVKTQWRTEGQLPDSPDPDNLYYHYDDSDGVRRYLTLLHFTDKSRDPWFWADLYVDLADGGFKGGCGGSKVGMPAGPPWVAPWSNYSLCTNISDTAPGGSDCGNEEISIECDQTCQGCHKDAAHPSGLKVDFLFSLEQGTESPPGCP